MHVGPSNETSHLYKGKEDVNKPKKQKRKEIKLWYNLSHDYVPYIR